MLDRLGYPFRRIISLKSVQKVAKHFGYTIVNEPMEYVMKRPDKYSGFNNIVGSIDKFDFNQWGVYGLNLDCPKPIISAMILFKHTPLWLRFDKHYRNNALAV